MHPRKKCVHVPAINSPVTESHYAPYFCVKCNLSALQKHLLAPRKQSVNLLKQLVEDGPSSMSDCERTGGEEPRRRARLCSSNLVRLGDKTQQAGQKEKKKEKLFQDASMWWWCPRCSRFRKGTKSSARPQPPPPPPLRHRYDPAPLAEV